jgi:hypothetical protein
MVRIESSTGICGDFMGGITGITKKTYDLLVVSTIFYDFPIILGMSSSQLLLSPSFFRGVGFPLNQIWLCLMGYTPNEKARNGTIPFW